MVVGQADGKNNKTYWRCVCDCGNSAVVCGSGLTSGQTQSCGCLQRERASGSMYKHGKSKRTPEYWAWVNIKTRCHSEKFGDKHYKGKGISVCERWLGSFVNFYEDMGERPSPLHSIERIDSNGHYEPSNCKWGTPKEQSRNKGNNSWHEYGGNKMILQDWANLFGVSQANLRQSIISKGIENVYEFYSKKYNGNFPNAGKIKPTKRENYNTPKPIIGYKDGMLIVVESNSIRGMSRLTGIHHHIIETSIKNKTTYKGWLFELYI